MIYLERTITIAKNNAFIDEQVILYKGDRNVEIQFILKNSPFKYRSGIETTYGQLIINRAKADSIFSDVSKLSNGKVMFTVTGDMIDELNECGDYDFQIRLFNEAQTSRVTLAPITAGITIREPICEGDGGDKFISYHENMWNILTNYNTDYNYLFQNCSHVTELDISKLDTSNTKTMDSMFYGCSNLISLDLSHFDTSKVIDMGYMFYGCQSLITLDVSSFDTSKVTDMAYTFYNCNNLIDLDLSNWDVSNVRSLMDTFGCDKLTNFKAPKNIKSYASFRSCPLLSHDSLISIINNLATITSTRSLELGSTNLAKLTDEEKAIATNKGWTLS